jgi:hypothetical protein
VKVRGEREKKTWHVSSPEKVPDRPELLYGRQDKRDREGGRGR